jgi:endo-1,4-beta-xylanase
MITAPQGEEWKHMDDATRHYDPRAFAEDLEAARQRICNIRQSPAQIALIDHQGKPVAGLAVEVVQTDSPFLWGEQLWGLDTLFRNGFAGTDRVRHYTRLFTDCLNSANCLTYWTEAPRNDGPKHMEFQGEDRMDGFQAQVDWALANGLTPKGHPIFWSIDKAYPEWLKRYPMETQWKFIEVRVRNLVARFKGKVKVWDIVNEAMWEAAPKNLPYRHWPHIESEEDILEYVVPILRWAREEDPDARYVLNDYGMEADPENWIIRDKSGNHITAKFQRDRFTALAQRLANEGAAPDALGMQAHTGAWMTASEQNAILDDFATGGLPLHYTEFWAKIDNLINAGIDPKTAEEMRAEYVANTMTVAFAHPSVEAFYFWGEIGASFGFKQDHNSVSGPSSSNTPTPTYHRVRDLLQNQWRTRESLVTDEGGRVKFRGFHGGYSLRYRTAAGIPFGEPFRITPNQDGLITLRIHNP